MVIPMIDGLDGPFRTILVTVEDDRVIVTLNRPSARNAIDREMLAELEVVCHELEQVPRILILMGGEGFFAAGADIAELRERRSEDALHGHTSRIFTRIAHLPMPVIAALDGYALGGGAELACAADFRLGTEAATFGSPEVGLGIIAAAGGTWRLRDLVGDSIARQMLLAGRTLDAGEALEAGLLDQIVPPARLLDAAIALAGRIARQDPLAVRLTKLALRTPRGAHPAVDELAQALLFESPAKFARMDAFLRRRSDRERAGESDRASLQAAGS